MSGEWSNPLFKQTVIILISGLILCGLILFPFRKKNTHLTAAWASIQSWLFFAPILLLLLAAGDPWPLLGFSFISILCAKEFFQITGMYHRSIFVWTTYLFIIALSYSINDSRLSLYNLLPMIFLGSISLIPILLNDAKNMVQYVALSLLCFIFMGWAFMHIAWISKVPNGAFYLIYIIFLTEVCDNIALAVNRLFGKKKIVSQITARRTLEGLLISFVLTMILAYLITPLLPESSQSHWYIFGLIAAFVGSLGDLVLSFIRRDLGVKDYGIFIIGRGGILDRMDRLIFVAPIYYYVLLLMK